MKTKLALLFMVLTIFTGCSLKQEQTEIPENVVEKLQTTQSNEEIDKTFFVGKWRSEEVEINSTKIIVFLNIENTSNETDFNLSFNIDTTESYYPVNHENRQGSLYFSHNDEQHKAEYLLTLGSSDLIKCKYSVKNCFGLEGTFEKDIEFTRLTKEEEEEYNKPNYTVEPKNIEKVEILREYAEYGTDTFEVKYDYKFDERENMLDIIEGNNLDELVEGKSDVETAITLMNWLCERYKHGNPPGGLADKRTPQALMVFADNNGGITNCRGLSLMLAQLIRAYNIKAFHITCMPYEDPFDDCHVVVSAYCDSLNKWIMLDPTYNLYLKNESSEIIGIDEFREILINDGELFANDDANYQGRRMNLNQYREYMAKNLIRLRRGIIQRYGSDEDDGSVILIPDKYMQNEAKNFSEYYKRLFMTSNEDFWKE